MALAKHIHVATVANVAEYMSAPLSRVNKDYEGGAGGDSSTWKFGPTYTLRKLDAHLTQGWEEGVARLREIQGEAQAGAAVTVRNVRRRRVRGEQGAEVDVTAYWRGRGDVAWERCVRDAATKVRAVHIVPMLCGVCTLTADQFFYRGAAAVRLCDLLTEAGYNVAITAAAIAPQIGDGYTSAKEYDYAVGIPIKPYLAPLEINTVAAVLCEVGFTRHYVFRHLGVAPFGVGSHCGRYDDLGLSRLDGLARLAVPAAEGEHTVYLPYDIGTKGQAADWVKASLDSLGIRE